MFIVTSRASTGPIRKTSWLMAVLFAVTGSFGLLLTMHFYGREAKPHPKGFRNLWRSKALGPAAGHLLGRYPNVHAFRIQPAYIGLKRAVPRAETVIIADTESVPRATIFDRQFSLRRMGRARTVNVQVVRLDAGTK